MSLFCIRCGVQIAKLGARGRMPKRCDECKKAIAREHAAQNRANAEPIKKICPWCKEEYATTDQRQRFCSFSCSNKFRASKPTPLEAACKVCGKKFNPRWDSKGLCGRACGFRWQKIQRRSETFCRNFFASENIVVACKHCGCEFAARTMTGKTNKQYCSSECSRQHQLDYLKNLYAENCWYQPVEKKQLVCVICDSPFESGRGWAKTCSLACRETASRWAKRYRDELAVIAPYTRKSIFKRDDWTCHLCGKRCDREAKMPDPLYPTIDHVVPLSKGGADTSSNVKCACFQCNSRKSDRMDWKPDAECAIIDGSASSANA